MHLNLNFAGSSFVDYLGHDFPHLLPSFSFDASNRSLLEQIPHGTTVLAVCYNEGVVMAGDRVATEGYQVSSRRIDKVYNADPYSAVAIAGAAGPCIEMARLFQTDLEHYDKIEGESLSIEGKANKLSNMIKQNLLFC